MYTDPGSGLLFVQTALAAVFTFAYRFRRTLGALFGRSNRSKDQTGPQ
jgi:hypothetical protein